MQRNVRHESLNGQTYSMCAAETQKMIAGHILKCVTVFRDYRLDVQINDLGVAMPLLDLKSTEQI